jgi:hypothetical protein
MAVDQTPIQDLPFPDDDELLSTVPSHIEALAVALEKKLVMVFTNVADRDATITSPTNGMVAWTSSEKLLWVRDTTWVQIYPAKPKITSGTAAPTGSGATGDLYFQYTA